MNKKTKDIIFILILGSFCTLLLVGIQTYTTPKIEEYKRVQLITTILDAAGIKYTDKNFEEIFKKNIKKVKKKGLVYYLEPNNNYIFEFQGRGLWGIIKGIVTLNKDLKTIENIRIIYQEETPGLGARITEEGFLNQFKGKKIEPALTLVLRGRSQKNNEVDAITGASMTSQALIIMLNRSIEHFRKVIQE